MVVARTVDGADGSLESVPSEWAPFRLLNRAFLALLLLLAPVKFGLVAGTMEIPVFPLSGLEWALTLWPPWLLPPLAGVSLLLSLTGGGGAADRAGPVHWVSGIWIVLLLGIVPGLIRTTEWDMAQVFVWHVGGAACMALAVHRTVQTDFGARGWLLAAVVGGGVLAAAVGWNQIVFGGFQRTLEVAREQGVAMSSGVVDRMTQGRACGTFVYPNSLAAHLVLVLPPSLVVLWRAGGRFEPRRVSRPLFLVLGGVVLVVGLALTGSRAGIAAFIGAVVVTLLLTPRLRRWRVPVLLLVLAAGVALGVAVNRGRGLSSLAARGDYYTACVQMAGAHPLTGVGIGEFFPWYMHLKPEEAEDTRRPHSFPLGLLAQAGILGGLASLACLSLPLWFRRVLRHGGWRLDPWLGMAVFTGLTAWFLHALLDFNVHIPGTLVTVAALPLLCADAASPAVGGRSGGRHWGRWSVALLGVFALTGLWRWPGERAYARQVSLLETPDVRERVLVQAAERAAQRLPLSPYPSWLEGLRQSRRRNHEAAAQAFRKAVDRSPHRRVFREALIEELRAAGHLAEAKQAEAQRWKP